MQDSPGGTLSLVLFTHGEGETEMARGSSCGWLEKAEVQVLGGEEGFEMQRSRVRNRREDVQVGRDGLCSARWQQIQLML